MPDRDPHYRFLGACLGGSGATAAQHTRNPRWSWDELVRVAANEMVLSSLQDCIEEHGIALEWPAEVATLFETVRQLNCDRNKHILSDVQAIAGTLNRAGVEPVVLKGVAHLLAGVYPGPSTRFLADFDLLLAESDFSATIQALRREGYSCQEPNPIETMVGNAYPPLWRESSVEIDLHRSLGIGVCGSFLPSSEVLRDSVVHRFGDVSVRLPSPEHLITHHIMHSQMHDRYHERIWPSLRTMYDFKLLQRRFAGEFCWAAIEGRFRKNGQYTALAMYLLQVENVLGIECPVRPVLPVVARLRWWRRGALRRAPYLRLVDPLYLFSAGLKPRTPLSEVLSVPGGTRYLFTKLFTRSFYSRRLANLR